MDLAHHLHSYVCTPHTRACACTLTHIRARAHKHQVLALLRDPEAYHNGFPVVTNTAPHKYLGIVLRNQLAVLLEHHCYTQAKCAEDLLMTTHAEPLGADLFTPSLQSKCHALSADLLKTYSTLLEHERELEIPNVSSSSESDQGQEGRLWLDLRPYVNPGALFVTGKRP